MYFIIDDTVSFAYIMFTDGNLHRFDLWKKELDQKVIINF